MLDIAEIIIGIVGAVLVMVFGGRGLIDIARERRGRKRQTQRSTTIIDQTEITTSVKEPTFTGPNGLHGNGRFPPGTGASKAFRVMATIV